MDPQANQDLWTAVRAVTDHKTQARHPLVPDPTATPVPALQKLLLLAK
jgi:hypothetical protein